MQRKDIIKAGNNWYDYCGGNPLGFIDPLGLDRWAPHVIDARQAAINALRLEQQIREAEEQQRREAEREAMLRYPSIYTQLSRVDVTRIIYMQMQGYGGNSAFHGDNSAFIPLLGKPYINVRDVTDEVNAALWNTVEEAKKRQIPVLDLFWFYNQVNIESYWDIKFIDSWYRTIGTRFPGSYYTPILFRGRLHTPESLGNFTYGYIGAALGIDLWVLTVGSVGVHVSVHGFSPNHFENEIRDIYHIISGFGAYFRGFNSKMKGCD